MFAPPRRTQNPESIIYEATNCNYSFLLQLLRQADDIDEKMFASIGGSVRPMTQ